VWLRASATHKAALPVPWAYVRDQLARLWGCRPWEVDDAPIDEIALALHFRRLEAEAQDAHAARETPGLAANPRQQAPPGLSRLAGRPGR